MMIRRVMRGLALLLCGLASTGVLAQEGEALTYVSSDASFRMRHADYWTVEEIEGGLVTLTGTDNVLAAGIQIGIFLPSALESAGVLAPEMADAEAVMSRALEVFNTLEVGEPEAIVSSLQEIAPISGLRADLTPDWLSRRGLRAGYLLVVEVDNSFVVLLVVSANITGRLMDGQVYLVASTFERGEFERPPRVTRVENREAEETMQALRENELVPPGGSLLLSESILRSGSSGAFEVFAEAPFRGSDFVLSADISFRPFEGVPPYCGLLARLEAESDGPGLFIGWDADSQVVIYASDDPPPKGELLIEQPTSVDIFTPHRLLVIWLDGELTAVVDGEPVIEDQRLRLPELQTEETFFGMAMNPSCVMSSVWVWGWE